MFIPLRYAAQRSESKKKLDDLSKGYHVMNCYKMCCLNRKNPNLNGYSQWQSMQLYDTRLESSGGNEIA